jgi:hypothetical protein
MANPLNSTKILKATEGNRPRSNVRDCKTWSDASPRLREEKGEPFKESFNDIPNWEPIKPKYATITMEPPARRADPMIELRLALEVLFAGMTPPKTGAFSARIWSLKAPRRAFTHDSVERGHLSASGGARRASDTMRIGEIAIACDLSLGDRKKSGQGSDTLSGLLIYR